jgi:predicted MFS family arabinose efflux permease
MFLLQGIAFASWVTRTPGIRDSLAASTAQMGLVIFGLSVGSMVGVLVSPHAVARFGGRPSVQAGCLAMVAGLFVVGLGSTVSLAVLVAVGLGMYGFGMGLTEIALNVEGATVEQRAERSVLPVLHGCFSAGTFLGALIGIALNAARTPVIAHLWVVAALFAAVAAWVIRWIPAGTGRELPGPGAGAGTGPADSAGTGPADSPRIGPAERLRIGREPRVLLLGLIVLGMAFAEGAANDWLPLITVDGYGLDAVVGSLVFAFFAASMAVGRIAGGFFLDRFGRVPVMRASAAIAAVGILLVVFGPSMAVGGVGVVLWGLGASLGFPVCISAAGDEPRGAAARVSAVATTGYVAFLVGPPLLGLLGEDFGLRRAMLVVLVLVVLAGGVASAVRRVQPTP